MNAVSPLPKLLVSVRSPHEAEAAFEGGADLIDIKEPDQGSLGRADESTIVAILNIVAGRRPVSAAQGELNDGLPSCRDPRLTFVKWGLAGCRTSPWKKRLEKELSRPGNPQTVLVAYADWQCALAPEITEVVAFACQKPGNVLLFDTHCKEPGTLEKSRRPTLLDWLSLKEIHVLCARCRAAGVRVALAGSLNLDEIEQLRGAAPEWFAVRGAVCDDNNRQHTIDAGKVQRLSDYLKAPCNS